MSKKKKNSNRREISDRRQRSNYIPFWLQGMEDSSSEITKPVRVKDTSSEKMDNKIIEKTSQHASDAEELSQEKEHKSDNPDWLSELSQSNPDKPSGLGQQDEETSPEQVQEQEDSLIRDEEEESGEVDTEPFPWEKMHEESEEESEEEFKDQPITEDDFAQTDLAEVEITESIDKNISEEISQDEDLPPWLQEIISVPQEVDPDQPQAQDERLEEEEEEEDTENRDELTKPLELSNLPDTSEDTESFEDEIEVDEWVDLEEESEQADLEVDEWADLEEETDQADLETRIDQEHDNIPEYEDVDLEEIDFDLTPDQTPSEWVPEDIGASNSDLEGEPSPTDAPASLTKGDTQSVDVSVEPPQEDLNQEVQSQDEEEQILAVTFPDPFQQENQEQESLPEILQEAQELLSRNEIEEAVERIRTSDDRSTYSQEIQTWLLDASNATDKPDVNFWELLGDVASENEDHDLAFDSYAKAIKSLLGSKEENDEIG